MSLALVVAVLLAFALLPSALNIPQSNPATVPEFAPVPPDESSETPPQGSLAALGLTRSSSLLGGEAGPPPVAAGEAQRRAGKRCVGDPPRQSEDPMSPPCVAFFEGDNGGATYQGVTRDEIVVVIHYDGDVNYDVGEGGGGELSPLGGTFCDLDLAPNTGGEGCYVRGTTRDHYWTKFARSFARHFNDRYQTYGRHVHFWIYWSRFGQGSVEGRRAAAAESYDRLKPFAVLNQTIFSLNRDAYTDSMVRRDVLFFTGQVGLRAVEPYPAAFFQKYQPKAWSFTPDIEHWAEAHSEYICTKMPPGSRVSHSTGGVGLNGLPFNGRVRNFGFLSTADPGYPGVREFADQTAALLKSKCGIDPPPEQRATYSIHGAVCCSDVQIREGTQNAARLKQADVTTLLWLGGWEPFTSRGAEQVKWYPEVLYAGDGSAERNSWGRLQEQNFMRNAWVLSHQLRYLSPQEHHAMQVCMQGDPTLTRANCDIGQSYFREYYMLFKAIQAAGPRLTPANIDRGLHALPRISSNNPDLASCFFDPGDYTCVKDYVEMWWDGAGRVASHNSPGCFRLVNGGLRVLPENFTSADKVFDPEGAPCNAFQGGGSLDGA